MELFTFLSFLCTCADVHPLAPSCRPCCGWSMGSGKQVSHMVNGKQLQLGVSSSAERYEVPDLGIWATFLAQH